MKANLLVLSTIISILLFSLSVYANSDIAVMGLIKDKVILRIDGSHFTIAKDEAPINGVQVLNISNDRKVVTLKRNGEIKNYRLGHGTNTAVASIKLQADSSGIYRTTGKINNKELSFLIDTGATFVSLSSVIAAELGIDYKSSSKTAKAETANGIVTVYRISLDSVEVGGIKIKNVEAAIHEGEFPSLVLLGMSFLKNLTMEREGDILSLSLN